MVDCWLAALNWLGRATLLLFRSVSSWEVGGRAAPRCSLIGNGKRRGDKRGEMKTKRKEEIGMGLWDRAVPHYNILFFSNIYETMPFRLHFLIFFLPPLGVSGTVPFRFEKTKTQLCFCRTRKISGSGGFAAAKPYQFEQQASIRKISLGASSPLCPW